MLASHDDKLIAHARKLASQARDPWPHFEHSEIGFNYRMCNIGAAIGRGQLKVLDERVRLSLQMGRSLLRRLRHFVRLLDRPGRSTVHAPGGMAAT